MRLSQNVVQGKTFCVHAFAACYSVISAVRSFSVKLAGGLNQGLSALVLIVSGIYARSQIISALEMQVNKGEQKWNHILLQGKKQGNI